METFSKKNDFIYKSRKIQREGSFYVLQFANNDYGFIILNPFEENVYEYGLYLLNDAKIPSDARDLIGEFEQIFKTNTEFLVLNSGFVGDS